VFAARIRARGWPYVLWVRFSTPFLSGSVLRREDLQGRHADRAAGAAADQVPACPQPSHCTVAWFYDADLDPAAHRRGDRIEKPLCCCDCSRAELALLGPREMSDLSPQSGPK